MERAADVVGRTLIAHAGVWNFGDEIGEAQTIADLLLDAAMKVPDPVHKVLAHEALGFTLFAHGELTSAHRHLEQSIGLCEDDREAAYLHLSAQDPRVHVRLYDGMILWLLGYPDRALRMCQEARRYADLSQHPFAQAMARTISLRIHQFRGEAAAVARDATTAIEFCEVHDFSHYLAMSLLLRGWASTEQGAFEAGLAEMRKGLELERATGARLYDSYSLGLLADACLKNGRCEVALEFLNQAKACLDNGHSGRFYEAEIYRLLGSSYLTAGRNADEAEQWFRKGLEIARRQGARSLELRLFINLHDLAALSSDGAACRNQLESLVSWFSEGFDTADLAAARSRLSHAA